MSDSRQPRDIWARYRGYLEEPPHRVVEWSDPETGARGWLVINTLRGGAAGGGTRMRAGLSFEELVYLAKTMELKFVFAGPPVGGAKSGIDFDPRDPRKPEVLARWFRHVSPYLRECYATAGDLNVDEQREVIPNVRAAGLRHPQEGVVRGHLKPDPERFERIIEALDRGVTARLPDRLGVPGLVWTVSDTVAGYGVARAVARLHERWGRPLREARAVIEGFGAVGAAAALELARAGVRVLSVSDAEKTLVEPEGLDAEAIGDLIRRRRHKLIPEDPRCRRGPDRDDLTELQPDIFVAAAISDSIDADRLDRMEQAGVSVIASGANHPIREETFGSTELQQQADRRFTVIADVIGSAGAACTYSYLMTNGARAEAESILAAVDRSLGEAVERVLARARDRRTGLLHATLAEALDHLEDESSVD